MRFNLLLVLFCLTLTVSAQQNYLPLNRNIYNWYEPYLNKQGTQFHTSIRPYRFSELDSVITYDEIFQLEKVPGNNFFGKLWNWTMYDTIVGVQQKDFHLRIDPLINFGGGYDAANGGKAIWVNTRGVSASGDIGEKRKVSFNATMRENQAKYPDYMVPFIKYYQVVPGQGKVRNFKSTAFDFANATGYLSYTPTKYLNFQLGHDKNFLGDGYRSMLLSDNALYYPFFKITTTVWKLKYVNLYAEFDDAISGTVDSLIGITRKFGSFHYLSYDVFPWVQVSLFEAIIWPANDSVRHRGFDVNYLNPIIFFRPIEFGLGSPDNAMIGGNIKFKPIKDLIVYGQFLMDDLDVAAARAGKGYYRNKFAIQTGLKFYEPAGIKNLIVQAEMNQANPYTYAQKEPVQNYSHYNQAIAHPLGANFREFIGIFNYRFFQRYYLEAKFQSAVVGLDEKVDDNFGADIFKSDLDIPGFPDSYGNFIGQGLRTTIKSTDLRAGILLNPSINLNLEGQIFIRTFQNENEKISTKMIMLSLKTDLFNTYFDF
ncbi:MAG: hypothetical protein IPH42_02555 [Bacteroidetes bacterium]|nr:hypothetical protein [Bacteroidota bacterium]